MSKARDLANFSAATGVVDADIGVNVQAYDATLLNDADIGSTVQAYDATILVDADIGSTVASTAANTFTDKQTMTAVKITTGAGAAKVLTSDAYGDATWEAPAVGFVNPMTTGGDVMYGGASGNATRLANGTASQILTSAGGTSAPTWATPAAGGFVLGTAVAGSYINSVTFSGIPSGTSQIVVSLSNVKTSGAYRALVTIGDSGGNQGSGYLGSGSRIRGTAVASLIISDGFGIYNTDSGSRFSGSMTLVLHDDSTNTWTASGVVGSDNTSFPATTFQTAGSKSLSQELVSVKVAMQTGSFESGTINIAYI